MRQVTDDERRARLAVRHALHPDSPAASPEDATRAMTVLHSTEPPTVYLSLWARVPGLRTADVDRALYTDRTLVKQLAMRRTLFVFPRDLLPAAWGSASARTEAAERGRMTKDAVLAGLGEDWLDRARDGIRGLLDGTPDGHTAKDIRQAVPLIDVTVSTDANDGWSVYRVLNHLGLTADIVRGVNTGGWHVSRPRWTMMRDWLGEVPGPLTAADGYREIVRRWLFTFGPGTEDDIMWWLGGTKGIVRAALAELDAVAVSLDHGATGWLLPDDVAEVPDPGPWVALLPVLDPTVMGWKHRDFYLGPHREALFDRNGNAGTTVVVDGRVVGCWVQDTGGAVRVHLLEPVRTKARDALEAEAARLTEWLGGFRVSTVYPSPAMKEARVP